MSDPVLAGKRILLVEDEILVCMLIEDVLTENGCLIVGPYSNVPESLAAAQTSLIDAAILDVNLKGDMVYPVAEALERREIPFFLLSGYGDHARPAQHQHWNVCTKPFNLDDLLRTLIQEIKRADTGLNLSGFAPPSDT